MTHLIITTEIDEVDGYTDVSKAMEIFIGVAQSILATGCIENPNGKS